MSETPTYLSKADAAALCGCSRETIQRYKRKDRLPNARYRSDGTLEVPVADLVAAGLLDPIAADNGVEALAARSRAERDLIALRQDHAVAQAEANALAERLREAREEIAFLRSMLNRSAA